MSDEQLHHAEGLIVEAVKLDKASIQQSCIEPVPYPDKVGRFLLVPVECPKGIFDKRVIVPAFYEAHCCGCNEYLYKGNSKVCLEWNFFCSDCPQLVLPQHLSILNPLKPSQLYPRQWMMANHSRRPRAFTRERMTPRIFVQKRAIIYVRAAHPQFPDGSLMSEEFSYPVVGYIKEFIDD